MFVPSGTKTICLCFWQWLVVVAAAVAVAGTCPARNTQSAAVWRQQHGVCRAAHCSKSHVLELRLGQRAVTRPFVGRFGQCVDWVFGCILGLGWLRLRLPGSTRLGSAQRAGALAVPTAAVAVAVAVAIAVTVALPPTPFAALSRRSRSHVVATYRVSRSARGGSCRLRYAELGSSRVGWSQSITS